MSASTQLRVRLSPLVAAKFLALPPSARATAVAASLTAGTDGVDLLKLITSVDELRRVGVLLNQALRLAHQQGAFDEGTMTRVRSVVTFIEGLRGKEAP